MPESERLITVLIAEDDALRRHFLVQRLADQDDLMVVGSVASARKALQAVDEIKPCVLLLDLGLPELSGLQVLDRLSASGTAPGVLVLTGDEAEGPQLEAVRHGARGFLRKSEAGPALPDAIRAVAAGGVWLSPHLVGPLSMTIRWWCAAPTSRAGRSARSPTGSVRCSSASAGA